jgi:hypothetical protein
MQDNRVSQKLVCTIDLTALQDAARFAADPEDRQEATDLINRAYQVQSEVMAASERRKVQTIADLESKHLAALLLKAELEKELAKLNRQSYEFQNESGRIAGRLQQVQHRLSDHMDLRKHWIDALLLPASRLEWEEKGIVLQEELDLCRKLTRDMQSQAVGLNNDLEAQANRIRTVTADALYLWNRLERLRGKPQVQHDRGTGLQA